MRWGLFALGCLLCPTSAIAQLSYVGGQTGNFAGTTTTQTITFTLTNGSAATPAAGDLVIVAFATGSTVDRTLDIETTGAVDYTLAGSELYQNGTSFDSNLRVAYRFMPGTPETQFRFAGGSGNNADGASWAVHVFRGVDTGTPLDVAVVTAGNTGTRLANPGSITPTTAGAWIYIAGAGAGGTGGSFTTSGLTDFRANNGVDTNDGFIGAGYKSDWASGPYDHAAFTGGGTDTVNDSWNAVTVALRPAAVGGASCPKTLASLGVGC